MLFLLRLELLILLHHQVQLVLFPHISEVFVAHQRLVWLCLLQHLIIAFLLVSLLHVLHCNDQILATRVLQSKQCLDLTRTLVGAPRSLNFGLELDILGLTFSLSSTVPLRLELELKLRYIEELDGWVLKRVLVLFVADSFLGFLKR